MASVLLGLLGGAVLRWWVLGGPLRMPDPDEATVGVQAFEFNRGRLSVFFLNQPYGGTIETGLVAAAFRLFGRGVLVLKAVPILCCAATAALAWRTAIRMGMSRAGQWCAPVLAWCGPAYVVASSTKERAFYGVASVLTTSYPLLALRLDAKTERRDLILVGLCLGLGWWQTPLVVAVALPTVLWLVVRRPMILRSSGWMIAGAVVGALPWLIWNVRHGWRSIDPVTAQNTSWPDRIQDFWSRLGTMTGLETPFDTSRQLLASRWSGAVLVAVVLVIATWRTRNKAPGLLAVLVIGYSVIYGLNALATWVGTDPRYLLFVSPILALCMAAVVPDVQSDAGRFGLVCVVAALTIGLTSWGLVGMRDQAERIDADHFLSSPGIEEVARLLEGRGVKAAITDIAGMQIAFLTEERVIASSFATPRLRRHEDAARVAAHSTYVLDGTLFGNDVLLRAWLDAHHVPYELQIVGKWHVFFLRTRVLPEDVPLRSFNSPFPLRETG